jgi:hypothetical protein
MSSTSSVHYLKRADIDNAQWDRCIETASNGLIYGYSAYLDSMAGDWDAIVVNNYEAVMPLPWRKKWGMYYIYQPFLCAQLGLFGNALSADLLSDCLQAIPRKFKLWEFPLNHNNLFSVPGYTIYSRINYILNLQKPYEELYAGYRENIRRNIRRSNNAGCLTTTGIPVDNIFAIIREQMPKTSDNDLLHFSSVYKMFEEEGAAKTYGILSAKGDLLASAVFLFSHKRAYYLLVGNHPNGRTLGASHALIDAFIKDHSGKDILLDFEGSDFRNLAFFYSSFGAVEENYSAIKLNRLPWYVKLLKK